MADKKAAVAKKDKAVLCKKCKEEMGEAYVLDVPVYKKNKDTRVRLHHKGYVCRDCLTTAFTVDGKDEAHGSQKEIVHEGKVIGATDTFPKGMHPRMIEVTKKVLKGIRMEK